MALPTKRLPRVMWLCSGGGLGSAAVRLSESLRFAKLRCVLVIREEWVLRIGPIGPWPYILSTEAYS